MIVRVRNNQIVECYYDTAIMLALSVVPYSGLTNPLVLRFGCHRELRDKISLAADESSTSLASSNAVLECGSCNTTCIDIDQ